MAGPTRGSGPPDAARPAQIASSTTGTPEPTDRVRQRRSTPHRRGPDHGREWRLHWRRETWSPTTRTKSRRFTSRAHLDRFLRDRLLGTDRPDLGRVTDIRVTWRHVGPWQDGDPS